MGTDNLFHRRKERKTESLRRRQAMKKAPYDIVLIVCEGEKTEPNYFNELKKAFRLSNTNIKIVGRGADPLSVVNFASNQQQRGRKKEGGWLCWMLELMRAKQSRDMRSILRNIFTNTSH